MRRPTPLAALAICAIALSCLSCDDVIFDTIRQEIRLEDAQIKGTVNSIVRYTLEGEEYLFCQNGAVWKKSVDAAIKKENESDTVLGGSWSEPYSSQWMRVQSPDSNVIKLAADETHLYALVAPTYADNEDTGDNIEAGRKLYVTTDGEYWKLVDVDGSTTLTTTSSNIFCTNTPQPAHRRAYLRVGATIYELSGETATSMKTGSDDYSTTPTTSTKSVTMLGDTPYFSSGYAMCSNETRENPATYIYYSDGDDLYYRNDGTTWTKAGDPGNTIYAMAYTQDHLLLGTLSGLLHVNVDGDGVPSGSATDFDTNAESTLSSYYQVRTIIAVDPSLTETEGDLYGSTAFSGTTASFSNVCLWAYYPGRGKWNCE